MQLGKKAAKPLFRQAEVPADFSVGAFLLLGSAGKVDRLLHVAIQEGCDLAAGAGGVGGETTAANTGGNAVLDGPSHGPRIVAVSGNVSKAGAAGSGRLTHGPPQHGDHLGAVDGAVGVRTVRDTLLLGPILRVLEPGRAAAEIRVVLAGEDRPQLGAGGGGVGGVGDSVHAVHQPAGADEVDGVLRPMVPGVNEILRIVNDLHRGIAIHGELDAVLGGQGVLDDFLRAVGVDEDGHRVGFHVGNGNFHLGLPRALGQLHLDGGGGAAVAGCCAQMVGFACASFRENKVGGLVAQGLGTSMLQIGNIMKNPRIWIAPTLASAITGPISTMVFKMEMNGPAISSGMGTCGMVGPIGVWQGWVSTGYSATWFDWLGLLLICIVLPAVLTVSIDLAMRKLGWVKNGDQKLVIAK